MLVQGWQPFLQAHPMKVPRAHSIHHEPHQNAHLVKDGIKTIHTQENIGTNLESVFNFTFVFSN